METTTQQALSLAKACTSAVNAYLMTRCHAETLRAEVDTIHAVILAECPIYADRRDGGGAITKSKDLYLSEDDDACEDFYLEADIRLKRDGIKPHNMEKTKCPALVAEHIQAQAETLLIKCALVAMGDSEDKADLIYLEKRKWFLFLICGLVVKQPGYKNPLTQKVVT